MTNPLFNFYRQSLCLAYIYLVCFSPVLTLKLIALLSVSRQLPALAELTSLYVGRTYSLWREGAVMLWLEETVKEVLRRVDAKDPFVEDCQNK